MTKARTRPELETLGHQIIDWIEDCCLVPEGALMGRPMRLADWQKTEILRIYDNPARTRRAILSFGRKNGKTSIAAMLLLAHLIGPAARRNTQLFSTAQSRDQAALLYNLAAKMVRLSPKLVGSISLKDSVKQLTAPTLGNVYRALSAEASTAYGLSPSFVVHDELGQVDGPRSELYEAIETATAAQLNPLSIVISTQATSDQDLLSLLIDDALAGYDPKVIVSLYSAPMDAPPFDEATIRLANPAFGDFQNPEEVMSMARDAERMPAREAAFRNLVLNQRVEAEKLFLNAAQWTGCNAEPMNLEGREVYGGLDLSEVNDLTALVLIGRDAIGGAWSVRPTFWLPSQGLADRAQHDRVPYDLWHRQGRLQVTPGASISYEFVAHYLRNETFAKHKVVKLGFDRWNFKHLKPWLLQAGFSESTIASTFVEFGQGAASMTAPLRELESLVLDRKLKHGGHPIMTMCAANATTEGVDASNRKLSKKHSRGRIDGMIALTMAIGVAPLTPAPIDVRALIG
jgi:phage terminase large subunit-like protein